MVLLHGPNGAGKTTILSAIELALRGEISSFAPDDAYREHLTNIDSQVGSISLQFVGDDDLQQLVDLVVDRTTTRLPRVLSPMQSRFYSDRCYLAQSALSRLLELYETSADARTDSPLTAFINSLLQLDKIDALAEGLSPSQHLGQFRPAFPEFRSSERLESDARIRLDGIRKSHGGLLTRSAQLRELIEFEVSKVDPSLIPSLSDPEKVISLLNERPYEPQLVKLRTDRREIDSLLDELGEIQSAESASSISELEDRLKSVRDELAAWQTVVGGPLEQRITKLRRIVSALPTVAATDVTFAYDSAHRGGAAELQRCRQQLAADDECIKKAGELERSVTNAKARLQSVDKQMAAISSEVGARARALSEIMPHIHSNECPVCGRNYSEVSKEPLSARLSRLIAAMIENSGRLETLSKEKASASASVSSLERELAVVRSRAMKPAVRAELNERAVSLGELVSQLAATKSDVAKGANLTRVAAELGGALADLRRRDDRASSVRNAVRKLAKKHKQDPLTEFESSDAALLRLRKVLAATLIEYEERESLIASVREKLVELVSINTQVARLSADQRREEARLEALHRAVEEASEERLAAKELADAAVRTRNVIVRRVFNESLNSLWRSLFVRLVPDEAFVPRFLLPKTTGRVKAVLETVHRSGKQGGRPGSMLSSANLNTAALTLFLALNLSVKRELPFLVLDDPVQSMDEMHVAQFAALLRALSKQKDRQMVIAVHERGLFDYLALELSPSYPGDRLITVELGHSLSGESFARPTYKYYERDPVGAAA